MKNKKKKILIFLLSAACLTAGAFGIAACKDKTADPLKQAYESYVGSVGDGALSFDEWKLLIGQNVKPDVKSKYMSSASIEANGALSLLYDDGTAFAAGTLAGNLVISYADGSTQTVALPSAASSAKKAPELDNKYSQYVQAAGDSALPYEQWLELIKTGIMPDVSGKTVTVKPLRAQTLRKSANLYLHSTTELRFPQEPCLTIWNFPFRAALRKR